MPLDLDPKADLSEAKPLRLAGREWHVAPLSLRQIIALGATLPKIRQLDVAKAGEGDVPSLEAQLAPYVEITRIGLSRCYPGVTTDDLLDLPKVTVKELVEAIDVVVGQGGGQRAAGEPAATSDSPTSTGESSSPIS